MLPFLRKNHFKPLAKLPFFGYSNIMAYEVTASRRRPQKFEDLVGQDFVAATLINSIAEGKIAHAYLFSGPRGCGKTSTARIMAKVLNCTDSHNGVPCGNCTACEEVSRGASLDVIEIDGASNTSVNDVRQIKDEVLFPPNSSKYKIYIIDEVHMLSTNAFNALLKTIEEPPPYVIFIFATTELHKVPATIKSRCQQFHFRLGSVEQIKDLLAETAKEMNIQADDEALFWIARESTGSFRDAYTLFDQVAAFSEGNITYEKIRDKLGLVGVERLNALCELCIEGKTAEAIQFIDEVLQVGVSIEQFISNASDYIRSLLFIKNGITKESLLGQSEQRFSSSVINAWSSVQMERALSLFLQLYRDVRYSLNPRFELELAISRLCWLSSWVSNDEVKLAVDNAKKLFASNPVVQSVATSVPVTNTVSSSFESKPISDNVVVEPHMQTEPPSYEEESTEPVFAESSNIAPVTNGAQLKGIAIEEVRTTKMFLASALNQTEDWNLDDATVHIYVTSLFLQQQLTSENVYLNEIISKILSKQIKIQVHVKEQVEKEESQEIPESVQMVVDAFGGEVVSVQDRVALSNEQESNSNTN